ncbi:hypothetical protein NMY22_g13229 [Coprinellus aureogranulatus]|nr:hypothetical protein NMY22_g13229 [Coprinellus aureogranulatus]
MPCDDARLQEYRANARFYAKVQRSPMLRCAYLGTKCSKLQLVSVPIERSGGAIIRAVDIAFRVYIHISIPRHSLVYNLDTFITHVDRYPANGGIPAPYKFVIFRSNHPFEERNDLVRSYHGGANLDVKGCLLVVKTDLRGAVLNVSPEDFLFIERMVIDTLTKEEDASVDTIALPFSTSSVQNPDAYVCAILTMTDRVAQQISSEEKGGSLLTTATSHSSTTRTFASTPSQSSLKAKNSRKAEVASAMQGRLSTALGAFMGEQYPDNVHALLEALNSNAAVIDSETIAKFIDTSDFEVHSTPMDFVSPRVNATEPSGRPGEGPYSFMDSSVPSGARVFSLQKVFLIVLGFCDWATLMDVARASAHARAEVRKVVKIVIYDRLEPFLGSSSDCDALFDMLNVQGGECWAPQCATSSVAPSSGRSISLFLRLVCFRA